MRNFENGIDIWVGMWYNVNSSGGEEMGMTDSQYQNTKKSELQIMELAKEEIIGLVRKHGIAESDFRTNILDQYIQNTREFLQKP